MRGVLTTERLRLALPEPRHFDGWVAGHAAAGPPISAYDIEPRSPEARTPAAFEALLASLTARRAMGRPTWFAIDADGVLVGSGTLFDPVFGSSHSAHIGYHVFNNRTGQGLGRELVDGLVALGFEGLCLHRIEACVEPENAASIAVLRKVGFRHEGRAERRILARGAWRDVEVFALTCEERGMVWQAPA